MSNLWLIPKELNFTRLIRIPLSEKNVSTHLTKKNTQN